MKKIIWPLMVMPVLVLVIISAAGVYAEQQSVPPNFKVAFIGDQDRGPNAVAVLELIKNEETNMVLHQGDFDYHDTQMHGTNKSLTFLVKTFHILPL